MKNVTAWAAIAGGYVLAFAAAGAITALRYLWIPPEDVDASSGMYAFGDMLWTLLMGAVFSLVPTWFALRRVRDSARFWSFLSWVFLAWSALAPPAAAVLWAGPLMPSGNEPVGAALALLHFSSILRLIVTPGSGAVSALAWWMTAAFPVSRRRFAIALACEAAGFVLASTWVVVAMARSG